MSQRHAYLYTTRVTHRPIRIERATRHVVEPIDTLDGVEESEDWGCIEASPMYRKVRVSTD